MTTRPTVFPDWALLDQVSGGSGKNNVIEPPAGYQNYGWDYQELPARNYDNWRGRIVTNWLHYLDEKVFTLPVLLSQSVIAAQADGTPCWQPDTTSHPEYGLVRVGGLATPDLLLELPCIPGCVLTGVGVKYYNGHALNDLVPPISIYQADILVGFNNAPTLSASLADFSGVSVIAHGNWAWRALTALTITSDPGKRTFFAVSGTTNDMIAGITATLTAPA